VLIAKFLNYFDKTEDQIQDNNKVNVITVSQHSFTIHLIGFIGATYFFSPEESFSGTHLCIRYDIIYIC